MTRLIPLDELVLKQTCLVRPTNHQHILSSIVFVGRRMVNYYQYSESGNLFYRDLSHVIEGKMYVSPDNIYTHDELGAMLDNGYHLLVGKTYRIATESTAVFDGPLYERKSKPKHSRPWLNRH